MLIKVTIGEVVIETDTGNLSGYYKSEVAQVVDHAIKAYETMYPDSRQNVPVRGGELARAWNNALTMSSNASKEPQG